MGRAGFKAASLFIPSVCGQAGSMHEVLPCSSRPSCSKVLQKDLFKDQTSHFQNVCKAKHHLFEKSLNTLNAKLYEENNTNKDLICHLSRTEEEEEEHQANVAYTSMYSEGLHAWYFDSGCSRHLTGSQDGLT
ncbi:unnamed protein product [Microthlaspi erraticum]|uniref:Uncharacterized protein n=1 Tax=Microthlaspi erraticum TaxID=1685480 RepID=A0A6D2ICC8_9BRAS|nr:unnamed protein product [Microthlaspi erraticum]